MSKKVWSEALYMMLVGSSLYTWCLLSF